MRYFKKLVGERIYLSPMNEDDAEQYAIWLNDPAVSVFLGQYANMISLTSEKSALDHMTTSGHNYAIVGLSDDKLVGNISLMDFDRVAQTATLGIFIGDDQNRGKGIGAEAIRLLLRYGFLHLNLHNIMLTVDSNNARAIACYQKVGFREFGRRRLSRFRDGKFIDLVYMDILRDEFV